MRPLLVVSVMIGLLSGAASAENRIFIIAPNVPGYSTEDCRGDECNADRASAFCRSREYLRALTYRKVNRDEITGAVPLSALSCRDGKCEDFIAIECAR
jgi:hypothetical protein